MNWDEYFREVAGDLSNEETEYAFPQLTVHKYGFTMPVSTELLMDVGAIPDTRPPRGVSPLARRYRFRMWRSDVRERLGRWAYARISGWPFPSEEDD